MNPETAKALDFAADSYNPLLALIALLAPFLPRSGNWHRTIRYYAAGGIGIALVYLFRAAGEHLLIWRAAHLDYSTHAAFAASLVVSLAVLRRRWLPPLAISLVLYYGLALLMRYHGVLDLLSAGAVAALLTGAAHASLERIWPPSRSQPLRTPQEPRHRSANARS